jgi:hypothetical protein
MARVVGQWVGRRARQISMVGAVVLAVLAFGSVPAWAAPAAAPPAAPFAPFAAVPSAAPAPAASAAAAPASPQLSVSALTPTKASLLATGFAAQATVEITVTVGGCVGHASAVATTQTLLAEFVTAPSCTGVAVATAKAGTQSATTTFSFATPGGTAATVSPTSASAAPAAPAAPAYPAAPASPAAPAVPDSPGPNGAVGDAAAAAAAGAGSTGSGTGTGTGTTSVPPTGVGADGSSTATVPSTDATGGGQVGPRPIAATCTVKASGTQVPAAKPGDTVCFTGAIPGRLDIKQGGTTTQPIVYSGMGSAVVPGITARGDNIVLEGFVSKGAQDNGFYVSGNNITVQDNDVSQVSITNDDVDAIRFFGNGITIAHNYAHDIWANPSAGGAPHTDCMQTYAHSEPASSNIRIEANRCSSPQFHQCIMAEGPHDFEDGASGVGNSANWLVAGNFFDCHAEAQTIALQDVHNVTFAANDFAGSGAKAIALQKDATGATVTADNVKGPGYRELVGIDDASAEQGYRGPSN